MYLARILVSRSASGSVTPLASLASRSWSPSAVTSRASDLALLLLPVHESCPQTSNANMCRRYIIPNASIKGQAPTAGQQAEQICTQSQDESYVLWAKI